VGGWIRECPVELMFVSLRTHCLHSTHQSAENVQKDRHVAPKCFKVHHTNRKYERMDVHCVGLCGKKTVFFYDSYV